jgi:hypothetical protein
VPETGHDRAWFQHDVFLHMFLELLKGFEVTVAMGARPGRRRVNHPVDARWLGPLPGGMAERSSPFFVLIRRHAHELFSRQDAKRLLDRVSVENPKVVEDLVPKLLPLAAVQRVELSLQLLVLQFDLLGVPPLLPQLLVEFVQLIFVLTLGAGHFLIAFKDPPGGKSFQIGASVPIGAAEIVRQLLKLSHAQSGGGSWSSRQLASESR